MLNYRQGTSMTKKKRFLKLDYTTALIVSTVAILLVSAGIVITSGVERKVAIQNDHKRPLQITNLSYCNGEKLDLFTYTEGPPKPVVIYIHGGGWEYGSKVGDMLDYVTPLVERGYAVASINYRLSRAAQFPAQIEDVYCAVRFLRAHALNYNLEASRIGLVGVSAGGHLAALAGNASDETTFITGAYNDQSSTVQAVVSINGLYDLEDPHLSRASKEGLRLMLEGTPFSKTAASPGTYLTSGDAPQFILYGTQDEKVPTSQSTQYFAELTKNKVNAEILEVADANHGLNPHLRLKTNPSKPQLINQIDIFLSTHLKK